MIFKEDTMKSFTAGPNENGVRLSRFVEGVTKDMPRSMMYKAFRNCLLYTSPSPRDA